MNNVCLSEKLSQNSHQGYPAKNGGSYPCLGDFSPEIVLGWPEYRYDLASDRFVARYYDATIGRFISPDSIVPSPFNPQSLNRYSYCLNNPLKYIDPFGHQPELAFLYLTPADLAYMILKAIYEGDYRTYHNLTVTVYTSNTDYTWEEIQALGYDYYINEDGTKSYISRTEVPVGAVAEFLGKKVVQEIGKKVISKWFGNAVELILMKGDAPNPPYEVQEHIELLGELHDTDWVKNWKYTPGAVFPEGDHNPTHVGYTGNSESYEWFIRHDTGLITWTTYSSTGGYQSGSCEIDPTLPHWASVDGEWVNIGGAL